MHTSAHYFPRIDAGPHKRPSRISVNTYPDAISLINRRTAAKFMIHETLHHFVRETIKKLAARRASEGENFFEDMCIKAYHQKFLVKKMGEKVGGLGYRCDIEERMTFGLIEKFDLCLDGKPMQTEREILLKFLEKRISSEAMQKIIRLNDIMDNVYAERPTLAVSVLGETLAGYASALTKRIFQYI